MSGVEAVAEVFSTVRRDSGPKCSIQQARILRSVPDGSLLYSQATVDTLRAQLEAAQQVIAEAATTLGQTQARAEAAEADAARYRWLREGKPSMKWEVVDCRDPAFPISRRKEPLDAAIDAAIARTKEQQA